MQRSKYGDPKGHPGQAWWEDGAPAPVLRPLTQKGAPGTFLVCKPGEPQKSHSFIYAQNPHTQKQD